ncbi:MAG: DUF4097 family beta strand repeat protein [Acidobacteriaceae bacterium]|nr:DUF4097 family beta strand repeat protein [Acidobacteriaceae bacterium]
MRARGSLTGPLILILIGAVFLIHALSPNFQIADFIARYWPYILIAWGALQLVEVCFRFVMNRPLPVNGVSGGAWVLVIFICLAGLVTSEFRRPDTWWRLAGLERGVQAFGEEHEFSFDSLQRPTGKSPHLVIESFRGNAKITGGDEQGVTVSGHKVIRAFEENDAARTNAQTPVELLTQGNTIIVRCHQDRTYTRTSINTDLEISLPKGASLEATGAAGDFDVSALAGDVDISSENAGVRLQNVGGSVKINTRRSDLIRCTEVNGAVDLRGHGTDIELTKINGQVTVNGSYTGSISLRSLKKPIKVENLRTEFDVQQVPGEIRLERGSITMQNVVGPTHLTTRATDVTIENFTSSLDLNVDRGDIELRPGHLPVGKMAIRTKSGNIELALPQAAAFAMTASTEHGDISNEFGDALKEVSEGRGARLEGSVGAGPDLNLITQRGRITVRKTSGSETVATVANADKPVQASLR